MFKDCFSYLCGTTSNSGPKVDMVALWTLGLVIATLLLWYVAKRQLSGISNTTKAEFIKKFVNDFFSTDTRTIMMLLDYNALFYEEHTIRYDSALPTRPFPYFRIDKSVVDQLRLPVKTKNELLEKEVYTGFEIDDMLLGHFEDIGTFEKQGFLNIDDVKTFFSWYIKTVWENDEIRKYISRSKSTDGNSIYANFEYIYKRCEGK